MHFQLFWRRIHFNNLNIIQIPVCFAFSFHFLHLFFAELTELSSTKRSGGHDIRFGRSLMFISDGETQYLCARAVAYTPYSDHWRANVLICGQWVWYEWKIKQNNRRIHNTSSSIHRLPFFMSWAYTWFFYVTYYPVLFFPFERREKIILPCAVSFARKYVKYFTAKKCSPRTLNDWWYVFVPSVTTL